MPPFERALEVTAVSNPVQAAGHILPPPQVFALLC